jgi:hypothetical protein
MAVKNIARAPANEGMFVDALSRIFGIRKSCSFETVIHNIDEMSYGFFPFNVLDLRMILERVTVVPDILNAQKSRRLICLLEEVEWTPALVFDAMASGVKALWVVQSLRFGCGEETIKRWYCKMEYPTLIVGTSSEGDRNYIAAPVQCFS